MSFLILNEQYQALLSKYGAASYNELYTKSQQANNDYNTKAQAAEQQKRCCGKQYQLTGKQKIRAGI